MKRTILFTTLFFIVIFSVKAQISLGIKSGTNISKEYFGVKLIDEDIGFRTGMNVGIFGKYLINNKFDTQIELLYSQQGYKDNVLIANVGGYYVNDGFKILSHNLIIPVLLRSYIYKDFFVEVGPQLGFCLGARLQHNEEGIDEVLKMDRKLADFSLVGGIGVYVGQGVSINARYNHGFTDTAPESNFKNRVIQISVSYNFWNIH